MVNLNINDVHFERIDGLKSSIMLSCNNNECKIELQFSNDELLRLHKMVKTQLTCGGLTTNEI